MKTYSSFYLELFFSLVIAAFVTLKGVVNFHAAFTTTADFVSLVVIGGLSMMVITAFSLPFVYWTVWIIKAMISKIPGLEHLEP